MAGTAQDPSTLQDDPLLRDVPTRDGKKYLAPVLLDSKLGSGGMGAVYRGRHLELGIDVAVKCLRPDFAASNDLSIPRFHREAHLAAKLSHQNLVRIFELRRAHGLSYLVLEFVEGETAMQRVGRKGPLPEREAAKLMLAVARGLAAAHRNREVIVHRDIKPCNILVSKHGEVKLADLGLAKALSRSSAISFETEGIVGTPRYMAPEQWDSSATPTPRTDVWAMGATLYYLLTGQDAIRGETLEQVLREITTGRFPDPRHARPELSKRMADIILRCTRRDAADRFADAPELARELQDIVRGNRARTRARALRFGGRRARWIALPAFSVVALGCAIAWVAQPSVRVPSGWEVLDDRPGDSGWARAIRHPDAGVVLQLIEPGTFSMGSGPNESGRDADEAAHIVEMTRPYYMADRLTTRAQYHLAERGEFEGSQLPVGSIRWKDARDYCARLGGQLPTEAQWEFAARGGARTRYWWGNEYNDDLAQRPNPNEIRDVSAGLWEWCFDGYRIDYEHVSGPDPIAIPQIDMGVLRGGPQARCADRRPSPLSESAPEFGFRVALDPR